MKKMRASEYRVKRIFIVFLLTGLAGYFIDLFTCLTIPKVSGVLHEMQLTRSYIRELQFQGRWVTGIVTIVLLLPLQFMASFVFVRFCVKKRTRTLDMSIRCMRQMVGWKPLALLFVGFYMTFFCQLILSLGPKSIVVPSIVVPLYLILGCRCFYMKDLVGRAARIGLLCSNCHYNLYQLTTDRCPECGTSRSPS